MEQRNIRFKAKSILDGAWVQGDLIHKEDGKIAILRNGFNVSEVDPSTICQFTGLTDSNGNEIWEHDFLQSQETKAIYEVVWDDGGFMISDYVFGVNTMISLCSALRMRRIKVVGNKYDKEK